MKKLFLVLLSIATLFGIWGYYLRIIGGDELSNLTSILPWGLWVASYIYFIGLSAGGFLISSLIYVFGMKKFEAAGRIALAQAAICLVIALLLILTDLGHPERGLTIAYHFNYTSVMGWMFICYNIYMIIVLWEFYLATRVDLVKIASQGTGFKHKLSGILCAGYHDVSEEAQKKDRKLLKILGSLGIPAAIIVHGGVGAIFATVKAHPVWNSGLFPILFLVSALASGGALLGVLVSVFSNVKEDLKKELVKNIVVLSSTILCFELLILFAEMSVGLYSDIPAHVASYRLMMFGPYWFVFWIVQLFVGAVLPLFIIFHPATGNSIKRLSFAAAMIVLGTFGTRLSIVIPPLIVPDFPNLPEAYLSPRFQAQYFPSLMEWLCLLGASALCIWAFILVNNILPLNEQKELSS